MAQRKRASGSAPLDIGGRLELFVDDFLIDRMRGVALKLHELVPRETAIEFDRPWEGSTCGYVTVFQDGGRFRMYYRGSDAKPGEPKEKRKARGQVVCMAESDNGLHWERPNLGLRGFGGSKKNNIVWDGQGSHNFAPFKDSNPSCKPSQAYKALAGGSGPKGKGLVPLVSRDGVEWKRLRAQPVITEGKFDSHNVGFWDAIRGNYVEFHRHTPQGGVRGIMTCRSDDFVHWTDPVWLDYGDAPAEHLYTNSTVAYPRAPHIYMAFPMRFFPQRKPPFDFPLEGVSDAVFMTSRDGLHWRRWQEAFIRPGLLQRCWVCRNRMVSWGMLPTKADHPELPDEYSLYVGEGYYTERNALRRYTIRQDGFVSVHAAAKGGTLVTHPLVFSGSELALNFSTSAAGELRAEIQGADGKALPGYEMRNCPPMYGDSLERAVAWKGGADLGALAGKPVRLRFALKDADLYALQFRQVLP